MIKKNLLIFMSLVPCLGMNLSDDEIREILHQQARRFQEKAPEATAEQAIMAVNHKKYTRRL